MGLVAEDPRRGRSRSTSRGRVPPCPGGGEHLKTVDRNLIQRTRCERDVEQRPGGTAHALAVVRIDRIPSEVDRIGPAASAVRRMVPALPGSRTSCRTTMSRGSAGGSKGRNRHTAATPLRVHGLGHRKQHRLRDLVTLTPVGLNGRPRDEDLVDDVRGDAGPPRAQPAAPRPGSVRPSPELPVRQTPNGPNPVGLGPRWGRSRSYQAAEGRAAWRSPPARRKPSSFTARSASIRRSTSTPAAFQALDEPVVGHAVGAGGGVDPLDPQPPEVTLAVLAVVVGVDARSAGPAPWPCGTAGNADRGSRWPSPGCCGASSAH